ncbi:hypothetical protein KCG44_04585 [Pacificimonas sp. WHA3]|uniref:Uncharacterized protein n=1 Tax=Pacificimonas pallii TaxID=2827236 RepID=A0ABS6SCA8_9SPHN|nr:hypothetical protein [Pacificimonas pallii]MBV7256058.1 hypothetical protein [Pacificimonas pallii]
MTDIAGAAIQRANDQVYLPEMRSLRQSAQNGHGRNARTLRRCYADRGGLNDQHCLRIDTQHIPIIRTGIGCRFLRFTSSRETIWPNTDMGTAPPAACKTASIFIRPVIATSPSFIASKPKLGISIPV